MDIKQETSSPSIEILDLDVKSFNALKRAGINTIADIEAQTEQLGSTIPPKQWANIINALNAYKGIPIPGSLVEEDMLGDELTFDEIAEMVGEIIIMDKSTESHDWYKAVLIEKIVVGENGSRRLIYYDGAKQRGLVDEMYFDKNQRRPDRAWRVKLPDKPSEPPAPVRPERAEEISGTFNYAVLTAELGDYLRHKEEQLKNEYMNFTANCGRIFAEAQEKLAKHGFGENNGVFEKWITSMGFNKQTIYNMISVFKFRSSKIFTNEQAQLFDSLSKSLQYEVAKPSAPPDLVERVMNGDITTHKDYIAMKKKLEVAEEHNTVLTAEKEQFHRASKANLEKLNEERERNSELEQQLAQVKESLEISEDDVRKAEERAEYAENKNIEYERRVKELENRPIDVAVPNDEEIERIAAERSRELLRAKDMECDRRLREMQSEGISKDKEISELKERLMTIGEDSEQIENFFEDMYNDAYRALKRCFEFVSESNFTPQTVNKLRLRLNSFTGVVSDFIEEMQQ